MNKLYITTPIYYVNDKPHVGTAYSTVMADIIHRYNHFFSKNSLFLTGVDEHGQKCQQAARSLSKDTQNYCDEMSQVFVKTWKDLNIQYDIFYRTTSLSHKQKVGKALKKLFDSGFIYSGFYEGWYSVSEEIFYTEKDLVNGLSPQGRPVSKIKEKNYFFKMSQFREPLIKHLKKNPDFIYPSSRHNEVLSFLNQGLGDLCISRPKSRLHWGVELPFDSDYVAYVWVDALLNYIFGADCWENQESFSERWKGAYHLIGKDILITHAVYWPCLLMALGIDLPRKIVSHGWLLNQEHEKMSKSKGAVVDPIEIARSIGSDSLRYFFAKAVRFGQDAPFSEKSILQEYNQGLANNLGNLFQRTRALLETAQGGVIPSPPAEEHFLQKQLIKTGTEVQKNVESFSIHTAVGSIMELLDQVNKYLEDKAPWKLIKTDKQKALDVLYIALDVLQGAANLLHPVIPLSSSEILNRLGSSPQNFEQTQKIRQLKSGFVIKKGDPLFPRIK